MARPIAPSTNTVNRPAMPTEPCGTRFVPPVPPVRPNVGRPRAGSHGWLAVHRPPLAVDVRHGPRRQGIHHQQCSLSASPESSATRTPPWPPAIAAEVFFSSRHHHHRPRETFGPQHIINELSHFPASFPDQSDHTDLNFGMTNNLPQKGALRARSRNPHALARPHGGHRIDANTGWQRCFDQWTLQRQRCWVGQWTLGQRRQRTSVNRTAPASITRPSNSGPKPIPTPS